MRSSVCQHNSLVRLQIPFQPLLIIQFLLLSIFRYLWQNYVYRSWFFYQSHRKVHPTGHLKLFLGRFKIIKKQPEKIVMRVSFIIPPIWVFFVKFHKTGYYSSNLLFIHYIISPFSRFHLTNVLRIKEVAEGNSGEA